MNHFRASEHLPQNKERRLPEGAGAFMAVLIGFLMFLSAALIAAPKIIAWFW